MREICHMVTERSLKWKIRGKKIFHSRNCRRCAYKHYFGDFTAIILFQDNVVNEIKSEKEERHGRSR